jgi:N-acetylglucosamine transport system substrate-binding protein
MPYFSSPESQERWKKEYELGKMGYIDASSVSINHTQSQMMMLQHKAAMVPTGDWVASEMKDSVPEGFKWGYMAVPFGNDPAQKLYVSSGISNSMSIYAKKPELNKKWSKEFLLWLTNADSQLAIVEKGGALVIRKDLGDTSAANIAPIQKTVAEYIKNHNVAFVDIYGTDVALADPNNAKARKVLSDNVGLMATGKKEPGPILEEADRILQLAVDAYKKDNK